MTGIRTVDLHRSIFASQGYQGSTYITNKVELLSLVCKGVHRSRQVWWHVSATRCEIAFMIILENYCDKTNFPGNSIEKAKCFMIKISRYF